MSAADQSFYVAGGPLRSDDPSYVERPADHELWEELERGEYCYVLTPRQMGKSSLMARTARRLRAAGSRVAVVDLTAIGGESSQEEESWYYGLLYRLHKELRPSTPLRAWWGERTGLPAAQRFVEFFREIILAEAEGAEAKVVVFLDEIDATLNLGFASSFFAAVRSCCNARSLESVFERLSFVLLGVASPNQLIADAKRTPFNIGRRIELNPFDLAEAEGLAQGLGDASREILERILYWSGGQPYLTQALCKLAADSGNPSTNEAETDAGPKKLVDSLVEGRFLTARALREETHLSNIQDRLLDQPGVRPRLLLYRRILSGRAVADLPTSLLVSSLKLSGIVRSDRAGNLEVANRVYERLFDHPWVRSNLPVDWARLTVAATLVTSALAVVYWFAFVEPRSWIEQLGVASEDYAVAELAYDALSANRLFPQEKADELLAQFWDRRARSASIGENRDEALLYWLRAIETSDTERRRRRAAHLVGSDWDRLITSLWHGDGVTAVAFSPNGEWLLTGSYSGTVRLWKAESGEPAGETMHHDSWIQAVAFSADGETILTDSADGTARLWKTESGKPYGTTIRYADSVTDRVRRDLGPIVKVALSPDGEVLLTGATDGTACLWKVESGRPIGVPMRHEDEVLSVAFSPDGKKILTGSSDGTARIWDSGSGRPIGKSMIHKDWVFSVAFSPDGERVLTGSFDDTAQLWNAESGEPIGEPMRHKNWVRTVAFSSNGEVAVTGGSDDSTARLWSVESGKPIGVPLRHDREVLALAFSPDGKMVLTGSDDGTSRLWQADSGEPIGEPMRHGNQVQAVAFSPNGKMILTGSLDGTARLWQTRIMQPIGRKAPHGGASVLGFKVLTATFSPDHEKLLTGARDGTARLWELESEKQVGQPMQHNAYVTSVAFSPDGETAVTGSNDAAQLWRVDSGTPIGEAMRHDGWVLALTLSPDGKTLLTGSDDQTAQLWRTDTGAPLGEPMHHDHWVLAVAISPDARTVLTGSSDGTWRLWEADSGVAIGEPFRVPNGIAAVTFGPQSKMVLTGGTDSIVRLWHADSGDPIGDPIRHNNWVRAVAFSPDSRAWTRTNHWAHVAEVTEDGLRPLESRFGPVAAWRFPRDCSPCDEIRLAAGPTGQAISIETWRLGEPPEKPLAGDPSEILKDWHKRLALTFDTQQRIVPRWPIPQRRTRESLSGDPAQR